MPHRPNVANPGRPRPGFAAVYIFALNANATCEAGPGRVLKVGRVAPNSGPRFQSQHYSPDSAKSTLAGSLIRYPVLWPWLGIADLDASSVRDWMRMNLDRVNLFIPAPQAELLPHLEMYVRARVGSVFEGSA